MLHVTVEQALWFLPFVAPICFYVAWCDMKFMKIPNKTVMLLTAVFAVIGLLALPIEAYLWRWTHLLVVLLAGFILSSIGQVGAGDAKFAAAMAPFVAKEDGFAVLMLFAIILLAAFATHRSARMIPAVRTATPDWQSWERRRDFPMGFALGGTLVIYLLLPLLI